MNIISNNCTAGFIYQKLLNTEYENPFIWCRFFNDDFLYLVENYNNINFHNYEIGKYSNKLENRTNPFYIRIDNKISINYTHYYFDYNATKPTRIKSDFFYNKIWETVLSNYEKRLTRMSGKPIFIFNDDGDYSVYGSNKTWLDIIDKLITLSKKIDNKIIILTNHHKEMKENNLLILNSKNIFPPHNLKDNGNKILEFIGQK